MNSNVRLEATKAIWTAYGFGLFFLMVNSAMINQSLDATHLLIVGAMSLAAFLATGAVWNWGNLTSIEAVDEDTAKSKNEAKLDNILSRLSDEERYQLRNRLTEDENHYELTDDGELVEYR